MENSPQMMPSTDALADLLEQMVNITSLSGREHAMAEFLERRLTAAGNGEVLRTRRSLVWRGPQQKRPLLVLAGHIDTVRPQGNALAKRESENGNGSGRIVGLGATDMKAGIAVMLALIESFDFARARFDVACVFYDYEEGPTAKNGLKRVLSRFRWLRKARLAVVLEPTDLNVEMGCNGTVNLEVRVPGVSAHAARPWTGRNAVTAGADWLSAIGHAPVETVSVQGLEFRETLEVTRLRAGSARNVLPGEMIVNLNHRFPPDRTLDEAVARVQALVPEGFEFKVRSGAPPGRVCLDDDEVQRFIRDTGARVAGKQGWTDVARFTKRGIPAFNYGPGLAELCHRADEYCPIENLGIVYQRLAAWLAADER
jgi:succinyl-diaminopimelate desuccinylase